MRKINTKFITLFLLLINSGIGFAQQVADATATPAASSAMLSSEKVALVILIIASISILMVLFTLSRIIKMMTGELHQIYFAERGIDIAAIEEKIAAGKKSGWQRFMDSLTDAVPVENEKDVMLDHDYDGIKELDNSLPPWWVYMFYVTIFFAIGYLMHYHVLGTGKLQAAEYQTEMENAKLAQLAHERALAAKGEGFDMSKLAVLTDAASIESGKGIFVSNCASCHGTKGEGGVGPNLTDAYWIHGGDFKSIYNTINNGVLDKGMIAWKAMLKPQKMQEVASYITTLQGTNPPGAKAPQGNLYKPEAPATTDNPANAPADSTAAAKTDSTAIGSNK